MYKQLLVITLSAFILTACGSSDSSSDSGNSNNTVTGNNGATNANGEGPVTVELTGEAGDFGDTAAAGNLPGIYPLCPAGLTSFSTFAENGGDFCLPSCPEDGVNNDDDDAFGSFFADGNAAPYTCFISDDAPGTLQTVFFSAAIRGCPPPDGCPIGTFPEIFITPTAGSEIAGSYTCPTWSFDVDAQDWSQLTDPAPFPLTLNADLTANNNGTDTTWSFSDGTLSLEDGTVYDNVAVGNGSFTVYFSNTYILRCKT